MRPRSASPRAERAFLCGLLILLSVYIVPRDVSAAAGGESVGGAATAELDDLTGLEQANIQLMELATASWFLAIGCSVGSFLNVVVWRLPLGMKLGRPKSHCPRCETPLSRRDNIPVLGWILLRGRCRYCEVPISPRYPLVEALTGAIFLGLLFRELLSGGACLALRPPNGYNGVVWILWYTKWDLVGIYLFHCLLLCTLLVMALIALDSNRVPKRLVAWLVAGGVVLPIIWPTLHPVPAILPIPESLLKWQWEMEWIDPVFSQGWTHQVGVHLIGAVNALAGLTAGVLAGGVLACGECSQDQRGNTIAALSLSGLFLGWQAAVSIVVAAVLLRLMLRPLSGRWSRQPLPATVVVAVLTLLQIVLWRELAALRWWPGPHGWQVLQRLNWPEPLSSSPVSSLLLLLAMLPLSLLTRRPASGVESPNEGELRYPPAGAASPELAESPDSRAAAPPVGDSASEQE